MNSELPLISIVVAFKESDGCVLDCIRSLLDMDYPPCRLEVIVVDDSGGAGIGREISLRFPSVRLIRNDQSIGCDASKQLGVDASTGDIVAMTDADCVVDRRWAGVIASRLADGADVVTGPVRHPRTFMRELIGIADFPDFQGHTVRRINAFPGCNFAARSHVLRAIGYRSTGSLHFGSDRLTSWRTHMRGYHIAYDPGMVIYHFPSVDIGSLVERRLRYGRKALLLRRLDPTLPGGVINQLGPLSALAYVCYKSPKDVCRLMNMAAHGIVNPWHVPLLIAPLIAFRMLDAVGILQALLQRDGEHPDLHPSPVHDMVRLP